MACGAIGVGSVDLTDTCLLLAMLRAITRRASLFRFLQYRMGCLVKPGQPQLPSAELTVVHWLSPAF